MRRFLVTLTALFSAMILVAGCSNGPGGGGGEKRPASAAVVVVSGGNAVSPFTAPDQACATGLAAGNTSTAIREFLLSKKYTVFTAPAMAARGQVVDQTGFGAFGVCPVTLPENMTVNSTGSIDTAGEHLARFINWLASEKGVTEVDFVAHSMGGLYSRAAIRVLATTGSTVRIRSLSTIGTPWQGSYIGDFANDAVTLNDCLGDTFCQAAMKEGKAAVQRTVSGSGREVSQPFLMGPGGWNEFQSGVLDSIPVALIAGNEFTKDGQVNSAVWPNDGIVALQSSLAKSISDPVLPHRRCHTFDNTHSIFVSNAAGLEWKTALTWNPEVMEVLHQAIEAAPTAMTTANREGCPA